MIYIGVDPGSKGGFAVSHDGLNICDAFSCSITELDNYITQLQDFLQLDQVKVIIELVPKYTGRNIPSSSAFVLGRSYGLLEGVARGMKIPVVDLDPKTWQRPIPGLAKTTGASRKRALRNYANKLYPHLKPTLATADAILILNHFLINK